MTSQLRWHDMVFRLYCFSCGKTTERAHNSACECGSTNSEEMKGPCWEVAYRTGLLRAQELAKELVRARYDIEHDVLPVFTEFDKAIEEEHKW